MEFTIGYIGRSRYHLQFFLQVDVDESPDILPHLRYGSNLRDVVQQIQFFLQ